MLGRPSGGGKSGEHLFSCFDAGQPIEMDFTAPLQKPLRVDFLGTWSMTVAPLQELFSGSVVLPLPGRPWIALRMRKAGA